MQALERYWRQRVSEEGWGNQMNTMNVKSWKDYLKTFEEKLDPTMVSMTRDDYLDPVSPKPTKDVIERDDNYCERCGRLDTCSKIYVCELRTDVNDYDLPCDMAIWEPGWGSSSDEDDEEDEEDVVETKCW